MYNIYDVFESRKDARIDVLYKDVQESFVEFELLQNTLEKQQVVVENAMYGLVDDETNEAVMEGFLRDKINKIIQFLKAQWNKLKEWFKAIINKLLNRGDTKAKLEKKLEAAAKGEPIEADYKEVDSQDAPNYNRKQLGSGGNQLVPANKQQPQNKQGGNTKSQLKLNAPNTPVPANKQAQNKQEQPKKQSGGNFRVPTIKEVLMSQAANKFKISGERPADPGTIQKNYTGIAGLIMQHAAAVFQGQTNEDIASVILKKFNIKASNTAELDLYSALTEMNRNEKGEYYVKDIANDIMDYLDNKNTLVKMVQSAEQKVGAAFNNMISNLERMGDSQENQAKLAMVQKDMAMHTKMTQMFVSVLNDSYNRISRIAEKATNEYISSEMKKGN
jgi:hypothetical protein